MYLEVYNTNIKTSIHVERISICWNKKKQPIRLNYYELGFVNYFKIAIISKISPEIYIYFTLVEIDLWLINK